MRAVKYDPQLLFTMCHPSIEIFRHLVPDYKRHTTAEDLEVHEHHTQLGLCHGPQHPQREIDQIEVGLDSIQLAVCGVEPA